MLFTESKNIVPVFFEQYLLDKQSDGNHIEWEVKNNILANIKGLRKLTRARTFFLSSQTNTLQLVT